MGGTIIGKWIKRESECSGSLWNTDYDNLVVYRWADGYGQAGRLLLEPDSREESVFPFDCIIVTGVADSIIADHLIDRMLSRGDWLQGLCASPSFFVFSASDLVRWPPP